MKPLQRSRVRLIPRRALEPTASGAPWGRASRQRSSVRARRRDGPTGGRHQVPSVTAPWASPASARARADGPPRLLSLCLPHHSPDAQASVPKVGCQVSDLDPHDGQPQAVGAYRLRRELFGRVGYGRPVFGWQLGADDHGRVPLIIGEVGRAVSRGARRRGLGLCGRLGTLRLACLGVMRKEENMVGYP
jgi:hypothetical protein